MVVFMAAKRGKTEGFGRHFRHTTSLRGHFHPKHYSNIADQITQTSSSPTKNCEAHDFLPAIFFRGIASLETFNYSPSRVRVFNRHVFCTLRTKAQGVSLGRKFTQEYKRCIRGASTVAVCHFSGGKAFKQAIEMKP